MGHGKPRTRAGGHLSGALGCKHVVHGAVTCRKRSGGARRARAGRAGVRESGVGRRATGGRCVGAAAAHIRVSLVSAQVGRVIGAPVSRRRQGRGAAHRRRLGRARVPSGVAAAGHVWGHRSALEFFALHLSPDAMAQPVINEGEVGRERRRVLGWAQGGCAGPDTPLAARHFAALVRRGQRRARRERGPRQRNVGLVRSKSCLGESDTSTRTELN